MTATDRKENTLTVCRGVLQHASRKAELLSLFTSSYPIASALSKRSFRLLFLLLAAVFIAWAVNDLDDVRGEVRVVQHLPKRQSGPASCSRLLNTCALQGQLKLILCAVMRGPDSVLRVRAGCWEAAGCKTAADAESWDGGQVSASTMRLRVVELRGGSGARPKYGEQIVGGVGLLRQGCHGPLGMLMFGVSDPVLEGMRC